MPERKQHPLTGNDKWIFNQPYLGCISHYMAVAPDGERELKRVAPISTCREGVIHNTRQALQVALTNWQAYNATPRDWKTGARKGEPKITRTADLQDPLAKEKGTALKILWQPQTYLSKDLVLTPETFLKVCDVVLGPVMVLLSPDRPVGTDWWRSDNKEFLVEDGNFQYVQWFGSDNWLLEHPVTLAIATGLYRQCFHLCGVPDLAEEILKTITPKEVEEVMSKNSQRLALQLVKRTRPYIEVPTGNHGFRGNYPFALGFWRRLIRLQRAIRRTNYAEALGQDFNTGWALIEPISHPTCKGVYNFWGDEGNFTEHHRHLMKVGAPRKRVSSGKEASR